MFGIRKKRKIHKVAVEVTAETNIDEIINKIEELNAVMEKANSLIKELASTDLTIKYKHEKDWCREITVTKEEELIASITPENAIVKDGYEVTCR